MDGFLIISGYSFHRLMTSSIFLCFLTIFLTFEQTQHQKTTGTAQHKGTLGFCFDTSPVVCDKQIYLEICSAFFSSNYGSVCEDLEPVLTVIPVEKC